MGRETGWSMGQSTLLALASATSLGIIRTLGGGGARNLLEFWSRKISCLPFFLSCLFQNSSFLCPSRPFVRTDQGLKSDLAATAKSLQSCPTLCDPIGGSPPGSPVPGILQARVLEWSAIAFSPIAYYRELIQYPAINHNGNEYEKEYVCVYIWIYVYVYIYSYMYESLCSIAKINTML